MKYKLIHQFETFKEISTYQINDLIFHEPSSINYISVNKYRITVEKLEEPDEVILERLIELYKNTDNWHEHEILAHYCKKHFKKNIQEEIEKSK